MTSVWHGAPRAPTRTSDSGGSPRLVALVGIVEEACGLREPHVLPDLLASLAVRVHHVRANLHHFEPLLVRRVLIMAHRVQHAQLNLTQYALVRQPRCRLSE